MRQHSHLAAPDSLKVQNKKYDWLEHVRTSLIDKLSQQMRQNHTGLEIKEEIPEI